MTRHLRAHRCSLKRHALIPTKHDAENASCPQSELIALCLAVSSILQVLQPHNGFRKASATQQEPSRVALDLPQIRLHHRKYREWCRLSGLSPPDNVKLHSCMHQSLPRRKHLIRQCQIMLLVQEGGEGICSARSRCRPTSAHGPCATRAC